MRQCQKLDSGLWTESSFYTVPLFTAGSSEPLHGGDWAETGVLPSKVPFLHLEIQAAKQIVVEQLISQPSPWSSSQSSP